MNKFKKKALAAAVGSALGLAMMSGSVQAAPTYNCASGGSGFCTMEDLFAGGNIAMDNGVVFDAFNLDLASGFLAPFSQIFVLGNEVDPLLVGLEYFGSPIMEVDAFFDYNFSVTSTDPLLSLSDAELYLFDATGGVQISEDLYDGVTDFDYGNLIVALDSMGGGQAFDSLDYGPTSSLFVENFTFVEGGDLYQYGQYFSLSEAQPPTDTPEPGSLALLGIGLAGLGFSRRRKNGS